MGKTQSKEIAEEIVIAQSGAGNNAGVSTTNSDVFKNSERIELYTVIVLLILILIGGCSVWRYCKVRCGRYMQRQLREEIAVMRNSNDKELNGGARQVIV